MTGKHAKQNRTHAKFTAMGLAALIGLTGVLSASSAPIVGQTEANWTNSEYVASSTLTAGKVPPPRNVTCEQVGLLGLGGEIRWEPPADEPLPDGYGYVLEIERTADSGPVVREVISIEDPQETSYRLSTGLLELLNDVLEGLFIQQHFTVTVHTTGPGEWTSEPADPTGFELGLLSLNVNCD